MRYTVQRGDTLQEIAKELGISVDELLRLNPHITDRNTLYAGRTLNLPDAPQRATAAPLGSSPMVSSPAVPVANQGAGLPAGPIRSDSGQNSLATRFAGNPQIAEAGQKTPEESKLSAAQDIAWNNPEAQHQLLMHYLLQQQNQMPYPGGFAGVIGY